MDQGGGGKVEEEGGRVRGRDEGCFTGRSRNRKSRVNQGPRGGGGCKEVEG